MHLTEQYNSIYERKIDLLFLLSEWRCISLMYYSYT